MQKTDKQKVRIVVVVASLIFAAMACRMAGKFDLNVPYVSSIRPLIYIGLFSAWAVSLKRRIVQTQARQLMVAIAVLLVIWLLTRTIKYNIYWLDMERWLWYFFYFPMLMVPMLGVFVAFSLGKPQNFRLPRWKIILNVSITLSLLFLVLTNDLHQLVFAFPKEHPVWTAEHYSYSVGYYIVVAWMIICAMTAIVRIILKCRLSNMEKVSVLPLIPIAVVCVYGVSYVVRSPYLYFWAGDMTVVFCLFFAATFECCIQCRLIQTNRNYGELFSSAVGISAQITNNAYTAIYTSSDAKEVPIDKLRESESGPVMLSAGTQLHNMPISGGHIVWTEDVSKLLELHTELAEIHSELQERNELLQHEYEIEREHTALEERNRLYDLLQTETQGQLDKISKLTGTYQQSDDDMEKEALLSEILILGSFVKRRKDFTLSIDSTPILSPNKLSSALQESYRSLSRLNICGSYMVQAEKEHISGNTLALAYDFFEDVMETALTSLHFINTQVCPVHNVLRISISTDCIFTTDRLNRKYPQAKFISDEDGMIAILPLEQEATA